jgi:hypothetical protein
MNRETMSPAEARAALDSTAAASAQIAALGVWPPGRDAAFGGIAVVASYDRRRYGVFVNGYRRGATRPVVAVLLLAVLALMVLQIYFREHGAAPWVPFAVGAAAFVVAVTGSVQWSRAFRREMERGA